MLDWPQMMMLCLAVTITGLAKGGFAGIGILATPILVTVMPPLTAVSVMLPILLVQDAMSVTAYRRTVDWATLRILMPGAVLGIGLGYLLAAWVNTDMVTLIIGVIALGFAVYFGIKNRIKDALPVRPRGWVGVLCGAGSGFTSMISHAGTPPFQIYAMTLRLPRDLFVGTSVVFFAMVNTVKVVPYVALGQMSGATLVTSALMVPLSLLATWAGIWLVRRIDPERFNYVILGLLGAVGLWLILDGLRGLGS